jgi:hypothetical protein
VDSAKVLQRAAEARLGGNGKFADLDIVFVDWYDWSGSRSPGCELIVQAIEGKEVDAEEEFQDKRNALRICRRVKTVGSLFPECLGGGAKAWKVLSYTPSRACLPG